MDPSLTFVGSGAAFGIVLGSSLLVTRGEDRRNLRLLAILLVGLSVAMVSIVLQHNAPLMPGTVVLEALELAIALAAGPLFAAYVRSRARGDLPPRLVMFVHLVPAVVVGIHVLATGRTPLPIRVVMIVQVIYTSIAALEIVAARRRGVTTPLRWPLRLTVMMVMVHAAQIVRTLFADVPEMRNVVPVTATAALGAVAILALREAILASARPAEPPRERTARAAEDSAMLLAAIDRLMQQERLWSDPGLTLERLARAAGSTPHRVSGALNRERGGFVEYVTTWRLIEVHAALENPANDIYTVDALAENAGFGSRSTFYAAFSRRFGVTPRELRKRPPVLSLPRDAAGLHASPGPGSSLPAR